LLLARADPPSQTSMNQLLPNPIPRALINHNPDLLPFYDAFEAQNPRAMDLIVGFPCCLVATGKFPQVHAAMKIARCAPACLEISGPPLSICNDDQPLVCRPVGRRQGAVTNWNWELDESKFPDPLVLPMTTGIEILPGQSARVFARVGAFCPRSLYISGNDEDWIINQISIGGDDKITNALSGQELKALRDLRYSTVTIGAIPAYCDIMLRVTYAGPRPEGAVFNCVFAGPRPETATPLGWRLVVGIDCLSVVKTVQVEGPLPKISREDIVVIDSVRDEVRFSPEFVKGRGILTCVKHPFQPSWYQYVASWHERHAYRLSLLR
jgi:hypothetical protein